MCSSYNGVICSRLYIKHFQILIINKFIGSNVLNIIHSAIVVLSESPNPAHIRDELCPSLKQNYLHQHSLMVVLITPFVIFFHQAHQSFLDVKKSYPLFYAH